MSGYKVTDTRQISRMSPAGTTVTVYKVWLVTDRGAAGDVEVETADWTEERLPGVLKAKAEELDLAFELTK